MSKKTIKEVKTPDVEKSAEEKKETPKETKVSALGIYDGDKLVRVYSKEQHGEDFADLAKEFCSTRTHLTAKPYTPPPAPPKPKEETEVVRIYHASGDFHRAYSLRQHGEDYKKLAEQYLKKYEKRGYVIK